MTTSQRLPLWGCVAGASLLWGAAVLPGDEGFLRPHQTPFVRGDVSKDGRLDLQDVVLILRYLYIPGAATPRCLESADFDDDGYVRLNDAIHLVTYLWMSGPMPEAPFPACGEDTTPDGLGCLMGNCL